VFWLFFVAGFVFGLIIGHWSAGFGALIFTAYLYFRGLHRIPLEGGLTQGIYVVETIFMAVAIEMGVLIRRTIRQAGSRRWP